MSSAIRTYRDLLVWQKAVDVAVAVLRFSSRLRTPPVYALADQLRRAALSVPANIAEGHGRRSRGDYIRFLSIANGSLREPETHLLIAGKFEAALENEVNGTLSNTEEVGRMLNGLYIALRRDNSSA